MMVYYSDAHSQTEWLSPCSTSIVKCWGEKRYIFIFLDGCALFPQYCRWTKTTASRQVNIELPESAVCSRQGLQQFITERQYKARPVWLELVNYNKSLGFFFLHSWLQGTVVGGVGIPQTSVLYNSLFLHFKSFFLSYTHTYTYTDRDLASKAYSKRSFGRYQTRKCSTSQSWEMWG